MKLTEDVDRKVTLASAALGMSKAEYVHACLTAGLVQHARHDKLVRMAFAYAGMNQGSADNAYRG